MGRERRAGDRSGKGRVAKARAATLQGLGASSGLYRRADEHPSRASMPAADNQIKGLVVQATLRYAAEHCEAAFIEALEARDPALANLMRHGTVAGGSWYPVAQAREVLGALRSATGAGVDIGRAVGFAGLQADLTSGPFRAIGQVASATELAARARWLFSRYVARGTVTVTPLENRRACLSFEACPGFDATLWQVVVGGCAAALTVIGVGELGVHAPRGGHDGNTSCQIMVG